ncbi:MAG: molybdopterin-guanine dinucleotide biosynthesis protein A [Flavobacteriales bacterium]|jgi:molybdopterin-guanine dinucleotide biosynthesis protein A
MSGKHHKHPPLAKPSFGEYGRHEIGILGTKCSVIQELSEKLSEVLGLNRSSYIDAEHGEGEASSAFYSELSDKVNFHRFDVRDQFDIYARRPLLNNSDLIFVNGNHFHAFQQLILIDSSKYESVKRKLDRLTNVVGFVLLDDQTEVHDFLLDSDLGYQDLPVLQITDIAAIADLLKQKVMVTPRLNGLILAGGKSRRMGQDKGSIELHGINQRQHMIDLLTPFVDKAFVSCRQDQEADLKPLYNTIPDRLTDMGPFGAIVSAFMTDPDAAWLVLAIDLPNFGQKALEKLVKNRVPAAVATSYISPDSGFPEPLASIWEPKSYLHLLQFLNQGYSCPRKVLINSGDTHLIHADSDAFLHNMNTPEDLENYRANL